MTLTVEEMCKSLARVEWKPEFGCPGCSDATFELTRFHPSVSYVIAYYSGYDLQSKMESPTMWTELYLRRISSTTDCDYGRKPCAVWASINGGEKSLLKESSSLYETLESEKFDFDFYPLEEELPSPLTVTLWIEFDSLNHGEKNVLKNLSDIFVQQIQCDVQFVINDERIGAHSSILMVTSPVFTAMFQQPHNPKEFKIEDVGMDIFKELLYYIYSGRLATPFNEETAKLLFLAAEKYDIPDLMDQCVDYFVPEIRMDNAIDLVSWSHRHSIEKLKEAALSFIGHHGHEISQLDDWRKLIENHPDLCVIVTRRIIEATSTSYKYKITADQDLFDDS